MIKRATRQLGMIKVITKSGPCEKLLRVIAVAAKVPTPSVVKYSKRRRGKEGNFMSFTLSAGQN
jgi:hypothetical protein